MSLEAISQPPYPFSKSGASLAVLAGVPWWQSAVFYQVYLPSFACSLISAGEQGVGDLRGLSERLDYLQDLGVDALLLRPHIPYPLVEVGFSATGDGQVAPEYGSERDFPAFLERLHRHKLRVVIDFFLNFRSGLDWRNPKLKGAMLDAMRRWLDLGVDGFRVDSTRPPLAGARFEDQAEPPAIDELQRLLLAAGTASAADPSPAVIGRGIFAPQDGQADPHAMLSELRLLIDQYPGCVLLGETDDPRFYSQPGSDALHLVFNFAPLRASRLTPQWIAADQRRLSSALPEGGWPANLLGHHDSSRLLSRDAGRGDGDSGASHDLARLYAALLLTLRGTPFLYYGEEIGMTDFLLEDSAAFRDELSHWMLQIETQILGASPSQAIRAAARFGRDKNRTPMQWSRDLNAGFCPPDVKPWLPLNPEYTNGVNVADQLDDPASLLHFYRRLIHLRRHTPALSAGDYLPLVEEPDASLIYLRRTQGQACLVGLNFSRHSRIHDLCLDAACVRVLFSNWGREGEQADPSRLALAPYEIYVGELIPAHAGDGITLSK